MTIYTLGVWTAKPGRQQEWIEAWQSLADAPHVDFPGAMGMLLRDRDDASRFISYGPWESLDEVETSRASDTFRDGVARIRDSIVGFEPHTMEPVTTVG